MTRRMELLGMILVVALLLLGLALFELVQIKREVARFEFAVSYQVQQLEQQVSGIQPEAPVSAAGDPNLPGE